MPEYTPQEIAEWKLNHYVDSLIERDRLAYAERKEQESMRQWRMEPKKKRDPRGSKKGVKRGKYKKHLV